MERITSAVHDQHSDVAGHLYERQCVGHRSTGLAATIPGNYHLITNRCFIPLLRYKQQRNARGQPKQLGRTQRRCVDRTSVVEGKSVAVRVDLGGGRIMKKKKT